MCSSLNFAMEFYFLMCDRFGELFFKGRVYSRCMILNLKLNKNQFKESGKLEEWRRSFKEHGIQPDVIRRIPKHRLIIKTSQDGKPIETASTHQYSDLETIPSFEWKSKPNLLYALFLLNPDVPSRKEAFEVKYLLSQKFIFRPFNN